MHPDLRARLSAARRILIITGAGVSAESGIPTFRGKDGYWRNRNPQELATPEAFARDPHLVWEWYLERRARVAAAQPNPAHLAIAQLARTCPEFLLLTQNVDDLHERAGTPAERIVHIHGELFRNRCSSCAYSDLAEVALDPLPCCPQCNALLRPGVVWFGEMLPSGQITRVEQFVRQCPCDAVFVVGTTAVFGYITDWALRAAGSDGVLTEINPEETQFTPYAHHSVRGPAGEILPRLILE